MADTLTSNPQSEADPLAEPSSALNTVRTTLDKFLTTANVDAVYGSPVHQGENLVIPAAEILSVAGFGVGGGVGQGPNDTERTGGSGGGGGGRVMARPVAVIVMSPTGVRVQPIVDVTKIVLAVFTTFGFMAAMFNRMSRRRLKLED
jgi:uncharacterized spore protein YtfJ